MAELVEIMGVTHAPAYARRLASTGGDDADIVLSVSREFVKGCTTPMVVMPGDTLDHPRVTGEEIASLASNVEYISDWRYPSSATPAAVETVKKFLAAHVPAE